MTTTKEATPPPVSGPQPDDLPRGEVENLPTPIAEAIEKVRESESRWIDARRRSQEAEANIKPAASADEANAVRAVEQGKKPPKPTLPKAEADRDEALRETRAALIAYQNARTELGAAIKGCPDLINQRRHKMEEHAADLLARVEDLRSAYRTFEVDAAIIGAAVAVSNGEQPYFSPARILPRTGNAVVDLEPGALLDALETYTQLFTAEGSNGS